MADSTVMDVNKMKVVELRKELKSRGLTCAGDKAELVARLQTAMSHDEHGDINLDSDEIDSDGVLEDEDDKSQNDILDDSAVDTLNEELALDEHPPPPAVKTTGDSKISRILKRKITASETTKTDDAKSVEKETVSKKIVLNRTISLTPMTTDKPVEKEESKTDLISDSSKIKISSEIDAKTRLELRAKRFGLPVKMSEVERKEARKQRFGQNTSSIHSISSETTGTLSENLEKLKKRAQRFGQSVSKIMTDIENKEKLEKRKAKFGVAVKTT